MEYHININIAEIYKVTMRIQNVVETHKMIIIITITQNIGIL